MNYDDYDYEGTISRARLALANSNPNWQEHKHPRRADGKFGSGGGTGGASGKGNAAEFKNKGNRLVAKLGQLNDSYDYDDDELVEKMQKVGHAFEDFALDTIANYPVPKERGMARGKALAERRALIRSVGKRLGFTDPDGWGGMNPKVCHELGW